MRNTGENINEYIKYDELAADDSGNKIKMQ